MRLGLLIATLRQVLLDVGVRSVAVIRVTVRNSARAIWSTVPLGFFRTVIVGFTLVFHRERSKSKATCSQHESTATLPPCVMASTPLSSWDPTERYPSDGYHSPRVFRTGTGGNRHNEAQTTEFRYLAVEDGQRRGVCATISSSPLQGTAPWMSTHRAPGLGRRRTGQLCSIPLLGPRLGGEQHIPHNILAVTVDRYFLHAVQRIENDLVSYLHGADNRPPRIQFDHPVQQLPTTLEGSKRTICLWVVPLYPPWTGCDRRLALGLCFYATDLQRSKPLVHAPGRKDRPLILPNVLAHNGQLYRASSLDIDALGPEMLQSLNTLMTTETSMRSPCFLS